MSHPSKVKGTTFERELVDKINQRFGAACAKRAWGSNGQAMGEHEEVDILLEFETLKIRLQAKRRKKLPQYLKPRDEVDGQVFREDRGDTYVLLKLDRFLDLIP